MGSVITPKKIAKGSEKDKIYEEIKNLQAGLDKTRVLAELFFSSQRTHFPYEEIKKIKRRLLELQRLPNKTKVHMYYLRELAYKFHQLQDYWDRTLKEIEQGTYYRTKLQQTFKEKLVKYREDEHSQEGKLMKNLENIYHRYLELSNNQKLDKSSFLQNLLATYERLKNSNPDKRIRITLVKGASGPKIKINLL